MTPLLAQRPRADRTFERLYRRHVGDVYRYALALMRNPADAEDVAQTTFMNAYRAFERGERPEKPANWLITITHNVCRQRFRQSARRPKEVCFDDDIGARLVETDDDAPTGEDIRRALGHLAFNQRAALVMRELEGRSYAEIAEILDLSPSAVETLIFRARRALREQLETSLTCGEAELAISRQLDGRLARRDKGALRAHLRECPQCALFARRQRAQRSALRSLGAVPVPTSLLSFFGGGGGSGVGTALALKAAAAVAVGAVVGGAGYEGMRQVTRPVHASAGAAPAHKPSAARAQTHDVGALHVSRVARGVPTRRHSIVAAANAQTTARRARGHAAGAAIATHIKRVPPPGAATAHPARPVHPVHPVHPTHPVHLMHPARHALPSHPSPPPHPTHPVTPARKAPPHGATPAKQLPGPYDAGAPAPAHGGNGK
jgi:RNA polymerase sigma factor (sigma-70 family)